MSEQNELTYKELCMIFDKSDYSFTYSRGNALDDRYSNTIVCKVTSPEGWEWNKTYEIESEKDVGLINLEMHQQAYAHYQERQELQRLRDENERLKARVSKLENMTGYHEYCEQCEGCITCGYCTCEDVDNG